MTIKDTTIDPASVRVKWQEQYVSQGVNERGLANAPGVLKGFFLEPTPTADTNLNLKQNFTLSFYKGGGVTGIDALFDCSFALYSDEDLGYACSIRETVDIALDLSTLNIAVDQEYLVWLEVDYVATGAATTAQYRVSDDPATDHPHKTTSAYYNKHAIIIGLVTNKHAVNIDFAYADVDYTRDINRSYPLPFLTDSSVFGSEDIALNFDYLEDIVDAISGGMADWNPDILLYGLLTALERSRLPSTDEKAAMHGAASPDSGNVFITDDELTAVGAALTLLIGTKIPKLDPGSGGTDAFALIQRIGGTADNATVTRSTVSIYSRQRTRDACLIVLIGGYLTSETWPDNGTITAGITDGGNETDVTALVIARGDNSGDDQLPSGVHVMVKEQPGPAETWDFFQNLYPNFYSDWDKYHAMTSTGVVSQGMPSKQGPYQSSLLLIFESNTQVSGLGNIRAYVTNTGNLYLTKNARYEGGWNRDTSGDDSYMAYMGGSGVIFYFRSQEEVGDLWSTADVTPGNWTVSKSLLTFATEGETGTYFPIYNCMENKGDLYEAFLIRDRYRNIGTGTGLQYIYNPIAYRNKWYSPPNSFVVTPQVTAIRIDTGPTVNLATDSEAQKWGATLETLTDSLLSTEFAFFEVFVEVVA